MSLPHPNPRGSRAQPSARKARVTTERFNSLVTRLYEAATDETLWPTALQEVVQFCGNSGTHLFTIDPVTRLVNRDRYFGMPEALMNEYNSGHILQCPRVANAIAHPERTFVFDYQHIDEHGIDHSDYYRWLQSKGDGIRYYLAGRLSLLHGSSGFISLAFRKQEGHSQRRHQDRLLAVLPHLNRSLQIGQRLGTWAFSSVANPHSLEQHQTAIVILDEFGKIVFANATAEGLARDGRWLSLLGGELRLTDPNSERRLKANIEACWSISRRAAAPDIHSVECITSDFTRYRVAPAPLLSRAAASGLGPRLVLVTITRISGVAHAPGSPTRFYGLTTAEARLAQELACGTSIAAAASKLHISIHTARTHVKRIFAKTDTHRLSELVALMLRNP
jgi:DNA-binding CsgD family transcriptional regulator